MQQVILVIEYLFYLYTAFAIVRSKNRELVFLLFAFSQMLLFPSIGYGGIMFFRPANIFPLLVLYRAIYVDRTLWERWRIYPIKTLTLILILFHLIQPFFITWLPLGLAEYREIQAFSSSYLMFFWGFLLCPDVFHLNKFTKTALFVSLISIIIIFYCKLVGDNPIPLAFSDTGEIMWNAERAETDRGFRVTGLMGSPNLMGNICVILMLLIFHFVKSSYKLLYLFLLFISIVFTGTRAPLVVMLGGFTIYFLFQNKGILIRTILLIVPISILLINVIPLPPEVGLYIDSVLDIFLTGSQNTGGSSTELRELQLATSVAIGLEAPIMGNGIGYGGELIRENGLFEGFYTRYGGGLAGIEGYPFFVMIDYGFVYLGLATLFFINMYRLMIKHLRNRTVRNDAIIAISLLTCFLAYIISSRPDNSWQMYCPLIGAFLYRCSSLNNKQPHVKTDC